MKVTIARTMSGGFEIHADGCRDLARQRIVSTFFSGVEVDSVTDAVTFIYDPDDFVYVVGTIGYQHYRQDMRKMPCCGSLPE
jgi:phosphatidylserine synthase